MNSINQTHNFIKPISIQIYTLSILFLDTLGVCCRYVFVCVVIFEHSSQCWRCVLLFLDFVCSLLFLFSSACHRAQFTQHELVKIIYFEFTVPKRKPHECTGIIIYCLINPKISVMGLCVCVQCVRQSRSNTALINLLI